MSKSAQEVEAAYRSAAACRRFRRSGSKLPHSKNRIHPTRDRMDKGLRQLRRVEQALVLADGVKKGKKGPGSITPRLLRKIKLTLPNGRRLSR